MIKGKKLTIKEEQALQLETLKYFDEVCNKEKITYFLAYGTLLGAARDKGFIEWDDDIDVWMMRDDYVKFNSIFHKYENEKYYLQNYKTDPKMPDPSITRICLNNTIKWPEEFLTADFHTGIYFDIFPLDYCGDDDNYEEKIAKNIAKASNMLWTRLGLAECKNLKEQIYSIVSKMIPRRMLINYMINAHTKVKNTKNNHITCYPSSVVYPKNVFDPNWFDKIVYLDFEDMKCPCPIGYMEVLDRLYGEWRIPSKTKAKYTPAFIIEE